MSFGASANEIDGNDGLGYYRLYVVAIRSLSDSLLCDGSLGDARRLSFANLPTARVHGTL